MSGMEENLYKSPEAATSAPLLRLLPPFFTNELPLILTIVSIVFFSAWGVFVLLTAAARSFFG